jgi:hypothetical protein
VWGMACIMQGAAADMCTADDVWWYKGLGPIPHLHHVVIHCPLEAALCSGRLHRLQHHVLGALHGGVVHMMLTANFRCHNGISANSDHLQGVTGTAEGSEGVLPAAQTC